MPEGLVQKIVSAFVAGTAFNLTDSPSHTILSATIEGLIVAALFMVMLTVATAGEQTPLGAAVVFAVIVATLELPEKVVGGLYNSVVGSIVPISADQPVGSSGAPEIFVTWTVVESPKQSSATAVISNSIAGSI